jgi:hypothetical protein
MRPVPPESLLDHSSGDSFVAAPEIIAWARQTFIDDGAELQNEDHSHLRHASLGALWTNVSNARAGRSIIGQCEHGIPPLGKWQRARFEMQLMGFFGDVPDFVLTFDARFCADADDVTFAALVEHELLHAGQEKDEFGAPKFRKSGRPAFAIRAHDFEGFIGIAARYGAIEPGVKELMAALSKPPLFSALDVSIVCGTCEARRAA